MDQEVELEHEAQALVLDQVVELDPVVQAQVLDQVVQALALDQVVELDQVVLVLPLALDQEVQEPVIDLVVLVQAMDLEELDQVVLVLALASDQVVLVLVQVSDQQVQELVMDRVVLVQAMDQGDQVMQLLKHGNMDCLEVQEELWAQEDWVVDLGCLGKVLDWEQDWALGEYPVLVLQQVVDQLVLDQDFPVVVVAQAGPDMDLVDMGLELVMGQEEAMLQDQGLDMEQVMELD